MPRFAGHRKLASFVREHIDRANRRKRPGREPAGARQPPRGPLPLAGGAEAPLPPALSLSKRRLLHQRLVMQADLSTLRPIALAARIDIGRHRRRAPAPADKDRRRARTPAPANCSLRMSPSWTSSRGAPNSRVRPAAVLFDHAGKARVACSLAEPGTRLAAGSSAPSAAARLGRGRRGGAALWRRLRHVAHAAASDSNSSTAPQRAERSTGRMEMSRSAHPPPEVQACASQVNAPGGISARLCLAAVRSAAKRGHAKGGPMTDTRFDVLAIGNAIVDVVAPCEDSLLDAIWACARAA